MITFFCCGQTLVAGERERPRPPRLDSGPIRGMEEKKRRAGRHPLSSRLTRREKEGSIPVPSSPAVVAGRGKKSTQCDIKDRKEEGLRSNPNPLQKKGNGDPHLSSRRHLQLEKKEKFLFADRRKRKKRGRAANASSRRKLHREKRKKGG